MPCYLHLVDWLEQHMLRCPSKKWMHLDCPGCGLQRSIMAMLKGDIAGSVNVYPPGILVVATTVMLMLHLVFKFQQGAVVLKFLYIVTTLVIVLNYIYKIFTNQLL